LPCILPGSGSAGKQGRGASRLKALSYEHGFIGVSFG
jgi:hypothetical protein